MAASSKHSDVRSLRGALALAALAFGTATGAQPAPGSPSPLPAPPQAGAIRSPALTPGATAKPIDPFATRAQRLQARPMEWDEAPNPQASRAPGLRPAPEPAAEQPRPNPAANPGTQQLRIPGAAPHPNGRAAARRLHAREWAALGKLSDAGLLDAPTDKPFMVADGTPDVFTHYAENNPALNPQAPSAVGKIFFLKDGFRRSCSAWLGRHNVAYTAAHCCYFRDSGTWLANAQFMPGYHKGLKLGGSFSGQYAIIPWGWVNAAPLERAFDVCAIPLNADAEGRHAEYYVGHMGLWFNAPTDSLIHALGYPDNQDKGEILQACAAQWFSPHDDACGEKGESMHMGCSMTEGSSGGPLVLNYRTDNLVTGGVGGVPCKGKIGSTFRVARFTGSNLGQICTLLPNGC